ncbi:MAG: Anti-ECFsigma factor, ChrR [Phenylobacterium sp.]|nr:Anti-ECFsigma factor, ChrR [Phenylobacterium sp.]
MAIRHHPSAEALADFLIGDCSPGTALLVERHTLVCPVCAARLKAFGGAVRPAGPLSVGQWRTAAEGVTAALVHDASGLGEKVYLLRLSRTAAVPIAALEIAEILVLEGALIAPDASFAAGDYISVEASPPGALNADKNSLCLATATDGAFADPD